MHQLESLAVGPAMARLDITNIIFLFFPSGIYSVSRGFSFFTEPQYEWWKRCIFQTFRADTYLFPEEVYIMHEDGQMRTVLSAKRIINDYW